MEHQVVFWITKEGKHTRLFKMHVRDYVYLYRHPMMYMGLALHVDSICVINFCTGFIGVLMCENITIPWSWAQGNVLIFAEIAIIIKCTCINLFHVNNTQSVS